MTSHTHPSRSTARSSRWLGIGALVLLGAPAYTADPPPAAPPRTLALEVTVVRYRPDHKERVLQNFSFTGGASNAVESLKAIAKSVDVLYRGTREIVVEEGRKALFDATETRPVVLVGQPNAPVPPATIYGLKLEVSVKPVSADRFAMYWEGNLTWSPELMDRRAGLANTMQFLGKAANAAQQASQYAGDRKDTVNQAAEIGLTLAQLFSGDKPGSSSIYELPVVKSIGLSGSRLCRSGEFIVNSTSAEAGTKEPQTVFVFLDPFLRD